MIPKPLLDAIREKRCIPIIGAGFSSNATLCGRATQMPDWIELTDQLIEDLGTEEEHPLDRCQRFQEEYKRPELVNRLYQLLHMDEIKPSDVHMRFAKIPYFDIICTTNYDNLLEDAYKDRDKMIKTIVEPPQIAMHENSSAIKILKMHGDFDHPNSLIITSGDYEQYAENKKAIEYFLTNQMMIKNPLYIGFSMKDPEFLKLKERANSMMNKESPKGYIVAFDPSDEEIESYRQLDLHAIPIHTNGKTKSKCLLKLFDEIDNQTAETQTTVSISINKSILFKNQTLRIKIKTTDRHAQMITLNIRDETGQDMYSTDRWEIIHDGFFEKDLKLEKEKWKEEKSYVIYAELDGQSAYSCFTIMPPRDIVVQTDKNTYVYGSNIHLAVIVPHASIGSAINYKILDMESNVVVEDTISVETEDYGLFQAQVCINGSTWNSKGEEFMINVDYLGRSACISIFISENNFDVQLDKNVYSWKDKVHITMIVHNRILNSAKLGIEAKQYRLVNIETSLGKITKYRLEEIESSPGIFVGDIVLSGFAEKEIHGKTAQKCLRGITRGCGPTDGLLACSHEDTVQVHFQTPDGKAVITTAVIRWNVGEVIWEKGNYAIGDCAIFRIIDSDMSMSPENIDIFDVEVYSNSDPKGIKIPVYETENSTGIFEGAVRLTTEPSKAQSLCVSDGDEIWAKYVDETLPPPDSEHESLTIVGSSKVGTDVTPPLGKIQVSNLRIVNQTGMQLSYIQKNQDVLIMVDVTNIQERKQNLVFLVQIRNIGTELRTPSNWTLETGCTITLKSAWQPTNLGNYVIEIYIWESLDNPTALSPKTTLPISVIEAGSRAAESNSITTRK